MSSDLAERLQAILGSNFKIGRELTGGGMARVFVAEEVELDRKLVVKVLPPDLGAGLSVERFRREIQLAAKLQHPHIVSLLSAGAKDGLLYYTMPFIEGESLRSRLARHHELPVHDALRILRDVTDALAYAHSHGVVHRDIKPDNVMISGHHALVTDFGVSKALSTATGSNTITSIGVALGTPAYMSPEQATADPNIDHRADIYSIGALAYELLTGRPPFTSMSPQQVLSAHITLKPEPVRLHRATVSPALEQVIMRCLEKTPADRWQSAEELLGQLEALATPSAGMTPATPLPARAGSRRWWFAVGAAVAALVIVGLALRNSANGTYETGATTQVTNTPGLELHPSLSPDGKFVAYASGPIGRMRIFVRQIGGGHAVNLTEGVTGDHRVPRWSADGTQISFYSDSGFFTVPTLGGTVRRVTIDLAGSEMWVHQVGSIAAMSPDFTRVVYARLRGEVIVRAVAGGGSVKIGEWKDPHSMVWSLDGKRVAFVTDNADFVYSTSSLGNVAPSAIWVSSADGGPPVRVTDVVHLNTSPAWTPAGNLLYVSNLQGGRDVYEQVLTSGGKPRGSPARVTTGLNVHTIALSSDGTKLVYSTFSRRANIWSAPIKPDGPTPFGDARAITDENQLVEGAAVSHDGRWLVYDSNRSGRQQLFKIPVGGGEAVQLTSDTTDHFAARWSADDRRIVFHAWRNGTRDLFIMNADGTGLEPLTSSPSHEFYPDLSPDGNGLLLRYQVGGLQTVARMTRANGRWSEPAIVRERASMGRWSPDGSRIATAGVGGVVVQPAAGGSEKRVAIPRSPDWPMTPAVAWSADGRWVIYPAISPTSEIAYFRAESGGGTPRLVLRFPNPALRPRRLEFDSDGKNLYFTLATDESDIWVMDLRKR